MVRLSWREFEDRVRRFYKEKHGVVLFPECELIVGEGLMHKFDLVSRDKENVVECKSYKWTKGDNFPSAKISTANEALFYFSRIKAKKKILVMQDHISKDGRSLTKEYCRRYGSLMDDVEVQRYLVKGSLEEDIVETVRKPKRVWYKSLYPRM